MKKQIKALINEMVASLDQDTRVHELSDSQVEALIQDLQASHCIGPCLPYIFCVTRNRFLHLGSRVNEITGYTAAEWKAESMMDFLPRILRPEHLVFFCKASLACFQKMRSKFQNGSYELQVNMDFTLIRKDGKPSRIMMQIRPLVWDGDGNIKISGGVMVEINHLKKHGLPVVTLTSVGELLFLYSPECPGSRRYGPFAILPSGT